MKKALMAGAASAVLAAMPVVGVFATTATPDGTIYGSPIADTLTMNVSEVCTLSRKVTTSGEEPNITTDDGHPTGSGVGTTGGSWATNAGEVDEQTVPLAKQHKFTATVLPGTSYPDIAESAFNVTCNDGIGGYAVTVDTTSFTGVTGAKAWNYNAGGVASGDVSSWSLESIGTSTGADAQIADGGKVMSVSNGTALGSKDFTIKYSVKVASLQETGVYNATAIYELIDL